MKNLKSLVLLSLGFGLIAMISCEKDIAISDRTEDIDHKIVIPEYMTPSEQAKVKVGKWLAKACAENNDFKQVVFNGIVDINSGASDELFVLDFINRRYDGGFVKDAIIAANDLSVEEFNSFFAEV